MRRLVVSPAPKAANQNEKQTRPWLEAGMVGLISFTTLDREPVLKMSK